MVEAVAPATCSDGGGGVEGCTDPCDTDDGSCEAYDMTCNADCTAGPFGGAWDAATCACINEETPVTGCTDPTAKLCRWYGRNGLHRSLCSKL